LEVAAEISPSTAVIISLKVHRDKARKMLIGSELVNMIKQRCVETLEKPAFQRPTFSKKKESNLGYCD